MTRDELLELLHVERYMPCPEPPVNVNWDDSEVTTARRRREIDAALASYEDHRTTTAERKAQ